MNEKLQINKVLKGNTSAFAYFVDTYRDMAIKIAYRIYANKQDSEDIVQNAFVKKFHNLHTFKSDSRFSTWFYRIVYNTALSHIRNRSANTHHEDYKIVDSNTEYSDIDIIEKIHENERKEIINQAMNILPRDEALILTLYYLEEHSVKDICFITGLSESNIKVKLHRSRKHFAQKLGSIIYDKKI